jgi:hypothetical protein
MSVSYWHAACRSERLAEPLDGDVEMDHRLRAMLYRQHAISDLDIWCAANLLIRCHGGRASDSNLSVVSVSVTRAKIAPCSCGLLAN